MVEPQPTSQHLLKLQNETLKRENEMLSRELVEVRALYDELKQSLDEAVKTSTQQTSEEELHRRVNSETESDAVDSNAVSKVQEKLKQKDEEMNKTVYQLNETRKELSDVQERLNVSEQVTRATQRRELQQEGIYEKVIAEKIYEKLRPELSENHSGSSKAFKHCDGE